MEHHDFLRGEYILKWLGFPKIEWNFTRKPTNPRPLEKFQATRSGLCILQRAWQEVLELHMSVQDYRVNQPF